MHESEKVRPELFAMMRVGIYWREIKGRFN